MKGLKLLQQLDLEARKRNHPNVPLHAITARRFDDRTTNALTAAVLRWLEIHGHYATRINTTGRRLRDKVITDVIGRAHTIPGKWIPGSTRTGTADIHAVINGRHCSIEIKCSETRDRIRPAQMKTKRDVERAGGAYTTVPDFEKFLEWYNELTGSIPVRTTKAT